MSHVLRWGLGFEWKGSCVWILHPQLLALFGEVMWPRGGTALLEKSTSLKAGFNGWFIASICFLFPGWGWPVGPTIFLTLLPCLPCRDRADLSLTISHRNALSLELPLVIVFSHSNRRVTSPEPLVQAGATQSRESLLLGGLTLLDSLCNYPRKHTFTAASDAIYKKIRFSHLKLMGPSVSDCHSSLKSS